MYVIYDEKYAQPVVDFREPDTRPDNYNNNMRHFALAKTKDSCFAYLKQLPSN